MLRIRSTPALTFILDGSMEYGAHIDEILNKLESDSENDRKFGSGSRRADNKS